MVLICPAIHLFIQNLSAKFRSFAYQIFLAHSMWDWGLPPNGGKAGSDIDWVKHADDVLKELVSIGDELCRFLTLPTASDSRYDFE